MPAIVLIEDKFCIGGLDQDGRDVAKNIPGANWSKRLMTYTWQPEYKTYKTIKQQFPGISVSDAVQKWVDKFLAACEKFETMKSVADVTLPVELGNKLFPYQRVGTNFMYKAKRVINADDMGLGKTLQAICACQMTGSDCILVVTLNSLKFTWEAEIKKWSDYNVTVLDGSREKKEKAINGFQGGFLIVNYESFKLFETLWECEWDVAIFDEAHRLKNPKAQHTIACKHVKSNWMWLLTGTPMENAPGELWSLLNILFPETFSSYWRFVDQYCVVNEIESDDKTIRIPGCASYPKEVHQLLSPIMIRRIKTDVLKDLPDKLYQNILVELDAADRKAYHDIIKEMIVVLDNGDVVATPTVIAQYTRLKQVCISRELLGSNRTNVHSAKLDALSELVESAIPFHKMVIFTTQLEALKLVKDRLFRDHGIIPLEISGDITTPNRQHNIDLFHNDPESKVFVITVKSGGVGLNLTPADICINLDKHPNPMVNLQAEDRLHRIGQKKNVTVYSIIAKDTLEEYIENMLMRKEQQFNHIVNGELTFITKYLDTLMKRWN